MQSALARCHQSRDIVQVSPAPALCKGRGFSCAAGPNRFKTTSPSGQCYGDFLMQTLLFEITCSAMAIGAVLSLMWLLGLTT